MENTICKSKFKQKIPRKPPTIKKCVIYIAKLGGLLAKKGDGDPGITCIRKGLKEFTNILEEVKIA